RFLISSLVPCHPVRSCSFIALFLNSIGFFPIFYSYRPRRNLHSFPTRRSSDLYQLHHHHQNSMQQQQKQPQANGTESKASSVASDRKSTRLNSSHVKISYAVFCLKKKRVRQSPGHRP